MKEKSPCPRSSTSPPTARSSQQNGFIKALKAPICGNLLIMYASQFLHSRQENVFYLQLNLQIRNLGQITPSSGRTSPQSISQQRLIIECARQIEYLTHQLLNNYYPFVDLLFLGLQAALIRPCHLSWNGLIIRLAGRRIREQPIYVNSISKYQLDTLAHTSISNYFSRQVKSTIHEILVSSYPIRLHDHVTFLEYQET